MEVFLASGELAKDTMAKTPHTGYGGRKDSVEATVWLDYLQNCEVKKFTREQKIGPYWTDAANLETKEVYEFWGCFWHGCTECYPNNRDVKEVRGQNDSTHNEVFAKVQEKRDYYKRRGFTLIEIWEHEYKNLRKGNRYMFSRQDFMFSKNRVGHLKIEDSFYGGRTNNLQFFYDCQEDDEIKYVDFTSLYPYVLKSKEYPIGHPKRITEDFQSVYDYVGFVHCKVLPPKHLYVPVLPQRIHDKLCFVLCKSCGENKTVGLCEHTDEERSMTSTWSTVELQEAIDNGYEILKIYEVLHYGS